MCCIIRRQYSLFSRDVRGLSKFGRPPCWCPFDREIISQVYAILTFSVNFSMSQRIYPKKKPRKTWIMEGLGLGSIPVLSEYSKALEVHVKRRYLQKISILGVDPASIPSEEFHPECLPPIEAVDLLAYLVLETSYYTKQTLII